MKIISFDVLMAAKSEDEEAVNTIMRFFSGYIQRQSTMFYTDSTGKKHSYINDEVCYKLETVLLDVIFSFEFRDPPDSFTG